MNLPSSDEKDLAVTLFANNDWLLVSSGPTKGFSESRCVGVCHKVGRVLMPSVHETVQNTNDFYYAYSSVYRVPCTEQEHLASYYCNICSQGRALFTKRIARGKCGRYNGCVKSTTRARRTNVPPPSPPFSADTKACDLL